MRPSEYIQQNGWCQQQFSKWDKGQLVGVCISTALHQCYGEYFESPTHRRLYKAMEEKLGVSPIRWQDAPGRTKAEVLALLEAVEQEYLDRPSARSVR